MTIIPKITERERVPQNRLDNYIEMARSFAAMSYQGVYLLNIIQNRYIYMSDYPLLRCGLADEDVTSYGIDSLVKYIPQEEISLLDDVSGTILSAFEKMPSEVKCQTMLYLNFHITLERRRVMICHKMKLLSFDQNGIPHILLGLVAPSPYDGAASIIAIIPNTDHFYTFSADNHSWQTVNTVHLSADELTMLRLTMQGYSIDKIATLMFKSTDTIKFYRRQVFQKLNVKNISEAIAYATHYCLI